jgi:hypothetical protein
MYKPSQVGLSKKRGANFRLLATLLSTNIEKSSSQQARNKLLESNLTNAGFELDKFDALSHSTRGGASQADEWEQTARPGSE